METEVWPNLVAACARARHAAVPRQRAAVGEIGARLRAIRRADAADVRRARGRRRADRRATPRACATLGARDVAVTGNLKFDVDVPRRCARARRASCARASARAARCGSPRRRATARRRCCSTRSRGSTLPRGHADGHRAAPSAALRRRSPSCCARAACRSCGAATTAPVPRRRRVRARRFAGRAARLLRGGRRRVRRRQPAAAGRPEPDRADRRGHADARRSAHVQLRRGDATAPWRPAPRCASPMRTRCSRRRRAARAIPRAASACATRRSPSTPRTAARPTGCGRGSRRACRSSRAEPLEAQPFSRRLRSSRSCSSSVPTADLSRSTPIRYVEVRLREVAARLRTRSAARSARRGWCARRLPGRACSTAARPPPTAPPARTPSPTRPRC